MQWLPCHYTQFYGFKRWAILQIAQQIYRFCPKLLPICCKRGIKKQTKNRSTNSEKRIDSFLKETRKQVSFLYIFLV